MLKRHVHFAPEEIELLRQALDKAWADLNPKEQAHMKKSELAEHILNLAAAGERDPHQLYEFALQKSRQSCKI